MRMKHEQFSVAAVVYRYIHEFEYAKYAIDKRANVDKVG